MLNHGFWTPKRCEIWTLTRTWREDPEMIYHPGCVNGDSHEKTHFSWDFVRITWTKTYEHRDLYGFVLVESPRISMDFHGGSSGLFRHGIFQKQIMLPYLTALGQADGNEVESKTKWQVNREVRWGQNNWGCFPAEFHRVWGIIFSDFWDSNGDVE